MSTDNFIFHNEPEVIVYFARNRISSDGCYSPSPLKSRRYNKVYQIKFLDGALSLQNKDGGLIALFSHGTWTDLDVDVDVEEDDCDADKCWNS